MTHREATIELARQARSVTSARVTERVDLMEICQHFGVRVRQASLQGLHGSLTLDNGALTAVLNESDSSQKQRFTLAHEIGHLLLEGAGGSTTYKRTVTGEETKQRQLERECDRLATEILMPSDGVRALIRGRRPGIAPITELAGRFDVSVESAALRFGSLTDMSCQVTKWQLEQGRFVCRWATGPLDMKERGESFDAAFGTLGIRDAFGGAGAVTSREEVSYADRFVKVVAEGKAFGSRSWRYVLCTITSNFPIRNRQGAHNGNRPRR